MENPSLLTLSCTGRAHHVRQPDESELQCHRRRQRQRKRVRIPSPVVVRARCNPRPRPPLLASVQLPTGVQCSRRSHGCATLLLRAIYNTLLLLATLNISHSIPLLLALVSISIDPPELICHGRQRQQARSNAENPAMMGDEAFDFAGRANCLRAAVLGANDGLMSTASLMLGVGAVKADVRAMVISGFAGLLAGASSMAIGEFVSVCSHRDVEIAQLEQDCKRGGEEEKALPSPVQAAAASALAFSVGAIVPLLAVGFIVDHKLHFVHFPVATPLHPHFSTSLSGSFSSI